MSSKKKELTVQETFYNLCKDLIRYIDKKIVRKYVAPNQAQIPKEKRIKEKQYNDNKWRYFFEDEETTNEERIKDIFKDNNFLSHLQILNNDLNVLVKNMEENKKDQENLNKKIQMTDEKMKISGEINTQLLNYFMEQNKNLSCINQNDIIKALEELKKNNSNNNLNSDIIQQYINNINKTKIINNNSEQETKKELTNNENKNNDSTKKENDKIEIGKQVNNNKINNLTKNKVIPNLIQAFDILNKNKKQKIKEAKKNKLMANIFESDSSDSNNENEEESDDEEEEEDDDDDEDEEIKEKEKININKYNYEINKKEKDKKFLNKKVKRNNN